MKKYTAIFLIIILLFTNYNCKKEKRYQRKIDGIWVAINTIRCLFNRCGPAYLSTIWRFDKNGDFFILRTACEKNSILAQGAYYLKEDTLHLADFYYDVVLDSIVFDSSIWIIEKFGWTPKRGAILKLRDIKFNSEMEMEKCPLGDK